MGDDKCSEALMLVVNDKIRMLCCVYLCLSSYLISDAWPQFIAGEDGPGGPAGVLHLPGAAQWAQQGAALPAHLLHTLPQGGYSEQ